MIVDTNPPRIYDGKVSMITSVPACGGRAARRHGCAAARLRGGRAVRRGGAARLSGAVSVGPATVARNPLLTQTITSYSRVGYFPVNFLLRTTGRPACRSAADIGNRGWRDRLGTRRTARQPPPGRGPYVVTASTNGSTAVAPASRSSLAATVIVQPDSIRSSTASTGPPSSATDARSGSGTATACHSACSR